MAESAKHEQGRRERKKERTRQHLAGVASEMFQRRGFDAVTVAEVAEAADVSKMTVFNYFARKEDLYLDRVPEQRELLLGAVADRLAGEGPVAALRRLVCDLIDQRHPLTGLRPGTHHFWQVVENSAALCARWRELEEGVACDLAHALALATGREEGDPEARYLADAVLSIYGAILRETVRRSAAGGEPDRMCVAVREMAVRLFDLLEGGLDDSWTVPA